MRTYLLSRHGPPDVLRPTERPDPEPGPGQLRARVGAIGINYAEILSRKGLYGWAPDLPCVLGMEAAGSVEALGADVTVHDRRTGWRARLEVVVDDGVDVALERVGGDVFDAVKEVLAPFGQVVVMGYASLDYDRWNPASWWRA